MGSPRDAQERPAREDHVLGERVRLLYAKAALPLLTHGVNGAIVVAALWGAVLPALALAWWALLAGVTAGRALLVARYRAEGGGAPTRWARRFAVGSLLAGCAWGLAGALFYVPGALEEQTLLVFVIGGMVAGAAASASSYFPAFAAFAAPALSPVLLQLVLEGGRTRVAMAALVAMFGVVMAGVARAGGRALLENVVLRFRNAALVEQLTGAQQRLRQLNASLEERVEERTRALAEMLERQRESESRLARSRALLEQAGVGILVTGVEGRIVDANEAASQLVGTPRAELVGGCVRALRLDEGLSQPEAWAKLTEEARRAVQRLELARGAGAEARALELSLSVQPFQGEEYVLLVVHDVTARKALEAQLARSGLLASVGTLAAGVAHEINNPLAFILSNVSYVRRTLTDEGPLSAEEREEVLEALQEVLEGGRRVRDIVTDLGTLVERQPDRLAAVDVHEVLEACLEVARPELESRAEIERELGDLPLVQGSRARLSQAFLNLLLNAAQAIPPGDPSGHRVTIRTRAAGEKVVVEIADTGAGMSERVQQRLFQPFFTTKPVGDGMGLGLFVCHNLLSGMGGSIEVRSRKGEGCLVAVQLRRAPPEMPQEEVPRALAPRRALAS